MPLTQENQIMARRRILMRLAIGLVAIMTLAAILSAGPGHRRNAKPRDVTLTGKIVDLHGFMTGKCDLSDHARCTLECIKAGIPAAIETEDGLVVIGQGSKGPRKTLIPLAFKLVELKGKLYERAGVRYIDVTVAKAIEVRSESTDEEAEESFRSEPFDEKSEAPEPDAGANGACCLPNGDCLDTSLEGCEDENGQFYEGISCDNIECGPEER